MKLERAIELAAELDHRNYYEILGVEPDCSSEEIDRRYYRLASRLHPDRHVRRATAAQLQALTRISARLTEAREILSDPPRRARYDEGLARGALRASAEDEEVRSGPDPESPVAAKLLKAALELAAAGDTRQALAKLQLARGFEPESAAIAAAIADLEPETGAATESATASGPEPAAADAAADADAAAADPPVARRFARIPLSTRVALKLDNWERFEALFSRNLSQGGVFLRTKKLLPVGASVTLAFALPDGSSFEVPGRIARSVAPGEPGEPGIGIQFLEMPAPIREHIESLLSGSARRAPSETVPYPTPEPGADEPELTVELAVTELLRLRSCSPRAALGVDDDAGAEAIEQAYAEASARLGRRMLTAEDPNLINAIAETTAHLAYARDTLIAELAAANEPAPVPEPVPRSTSETPSAGIEIATGDERGPRRAPAPLKARPVMTPRSLADLGPRGVAASEDSGDAERIFDLIAEGHYEAAIEMIAVVVPDKAPPRLIAARHIARGYLAERDGDRDLARVEFESALLADRTSCEAIVSLRKLKGGG